MFSGALRVSSEDARVISDVVQLLGFLPAHIPTAFPLSNTSGSIRQRPLNTKPDIRKVCDSGRSREI